MMGAASAAAMRQRCIVQLAASERDELASMPVAGTAPARRLMPARILLKADRGPAGPSGGDTEIAEAVEVSQPTIARVRRHPRPGGRVLPGGGGDRAGHGSSQHASAGRAG